MLTTKEITLAFLETGNHVHAAPPKAVSIAVYRGGDYINFIYIQY
jgi:hypothetical protein